MESTIRIEILGEMRVHGPGGAPVELPASRKTRALLAYLARTGRFQSRQHLCDLLWDGPDDPRGALRWSLSRLRAGMDRDEAPAIESDRRGVGLIAGAYTTDLEDAERLMNATGGEPSVDTLRKAAALFRGDLLEELDLLDCFRFHSWVVGERETARTLRLRILGALIDRVPETEEALSHARTRVSIDPLDEAAHTRVIQLLLSMQRHDDAQEQADSYRRTLEIELGQVPPEVSKRLRKAVHADAPVRRAVARPRPAAVATAAVEVLPLVGRDAERTALASWLAAPQSAHPMAVIAGEPGAGKTRLMGEVLTTLPEGTPVIHGRAYRAESARAFGPWRDALADVEGSATVLSAASDAGAEQQQRAALFDELLTLIALRGTADSRLVIALDDLQWLDESSAAFMHFLARARPDNIALIATVRAEELVDNPAVGDALDSLRTEGTIIDVELAPLARDAVDAICNAVGPGVDAGAVFERSEGNAFLATELARALARGETELPGSTRNLVSARFQGLSEAARDLLPWAAALGRTFHVDVLERVTGVDPIALVESVGELEERGIFEPRQSGAYDFVHELVRDAAYRKLSAPRQRIVHRRIARSLDTWDDEGADFSAAELMRHAELGGEHALVCRAGLEAARDAINVCAWADACVLADRGLQYARALPTVERIPITLDLLSHRVTAGTVVGRHPDELAPAIEQVVEHGSAEQRAHALYLRSVVYNDRGEDSTAVEGMLEAADEGRLAEPAPAARQLANSARCLLHIERDVDKARMLISEARETLGTLGLEDVELSWSEALLARWDGNAESSTQHLLRAIELGKSTQSRWRLASCLTHLIMVACEAGDLDRVEQLSRGGLVYGRDDGEPLKSPFVEALAGLADFLRDPADTERLLRAAETLRTRGAKAQLAYVQAEYARGLLQHGQLPAAEAAAREAIELAGSIDRRVIHTDALLTLTELRHALGDREGALAALARAEPDAAAPDALSARVRARLDELVRALRD